MGLLVRLPDDSHLRCPARRLMAVFRSGDRRVPLGVALHVLEILLDAFLDR